MESTRVVVPLWIQVTKGDGDLVNKRTRQEMTRESLVFALRPIPHRTVRLSNTRSCQSLAGQSDFCM